MFLSPSPFHEAIDLVPPESSKRRLADRVGIGNGLSDAFWCIFEPHLTEKRDGRGRPAFSKRATLEAILWVATTRRNWRDIPTRYGVWNSIYRQFSRWSEAGTWEFMLRQHIPDGDVNAALDVIMDLWGREKHRRGQAMVARADGLYPELSGTMS